MFVSYNLLFRLQIMKVSVDPENVKVKKVMKNGTVSVGREYAGKTIEIAILEIKEEEA